MSVNQIQVNPAAQHGRVGSAPPQVGGLAPVVAQGQGGLPVQDPHAVLQGQGRLPPAQPVGGLGQGGLFPPPVPQFQQGGQFPGGQLGGQLPGGLQGGQLPGGLQGGQLPGGHQGGQLPGGFQGAQNWQPPQNLGGAAVPGFNQAAVLGHGMNNVYMNANFAVNAAMRAEHQSRLVSEHYESLAKAQARTERWSRDLKINQEIAKYKSPADKMAVGYLIEEHFDLKELQ